MICYVITREGWGDVLVFSSRRSAENNPVVADGDAVFDSPEELLENYNHLEWSRLVGLAGLSPEYLGSRVESARRVFDGLARRAVPAPEDLDGILSMVARNRDAQRRKVRVMVDEATTEVKQPRTGKLDPAAKISFGKDAEGKHYGPDNTPHAAGSNREKRFQKLARGMTVAAAVEAGVASDKLADLHNSGAIVISGMEPPAPKAVKEPKAPKEPKAKKADQEATTQQTAA